jgi:anti-anti-sigma regulatory factor
VQFKAEVAVHEAFRIVRLVGRLQAEHVPDLMTACAEFRTLVRLDLADLVSMDPSGLETLVLMQQRGARLEGASPYVSLQLESARPSHVQLPPTRRRRGTNPTHESGNRALNKENT